MQKKSFRICKKIDKRNLNWYGKIFFTLIAFLLCAELSAHSGMLWGEKNLRVSKTKWFDIIYPERCAESAAILYEKADSVYEKVTAQYGLEPAFRMPVVITPAVDQFNAFWTAVPYNHIALYDTGSSGASELAVFSETLLSTFRHELTHAVTYNMKNGFWRFMGYVFGDCVTPGMLSVTTGMAEGATVTSESAGGEGRLNDEYAKHYVKQAKIENQFPSYHDVSGAADIMPGGAPYYFNGAFHGWLQEKYGLKAYAEFWYRVVNGKNFTISGAFKKAFGIKLTKAWKEFEKDYEVPDIAANPVKAGLVQDFFEPGASDYSMMNKAGSQYESLTAAESAAGSGRLVWFDRFGGRVFSADFADAADVAAVPSPVKYRQLFSHRGLSDVRLSNDGRFLSLSYISGNAAGDTARVKLYDFGSSLQGDEANEGSAGVAGSAGFDGAAGADEVAEAAKVAEAAGASPASSGYFYTVKVSGLKEAQVVKSGGGWYLVAQKYMAQHYSLVIFQLQLSENGRRITGIQQVAEHVFGAETNPYAFTGLDDSSFGSGDLAEDSLAEGGLAGGSFAYLKKSGLNYSLCLCTLSGETVSEYAFPQGMAVRSLSYHGGSFYFSYAQKGSLPRLGSLNLKDKKLSLSGEDISGGVYNPVCLGGKIIYIGNFFRQNRLLCMQAAGKTINPTASAEEAAAAGEVHTTSSESAFTITSGETAKTNPLPSKAYNPFPYITRGIFIPLSDYSSNNFGPVSNYKSESLPFCLGGTFVTANPWTEGSSDLFQLTCGYYAPSDSVGTALTITQGTATSLFHTQTQLKSEFNSKGWRQGGIISDISSVFYFGNYSSITVSNNATGLFGHEEKAPDEYYYSLSDALTLQYSNIRRAGPGRFERAGFMLAAGIGRRCDAYFNKPSKKLKDTSVITASAAICIPHLLPFESRYGFTYNLPLTVTASLLPSSSLYGYADIYGKPVGTAFIEGSAETTLFSVDIQKAIPVFTALYLNDLYISGGYTAAGTAGTASKGGFQPAWLGDYFNALADGRGYYLASAYLKTGLEFTPNIGTFAKSSFKMNLYGLVIYTINPVNNPGKEIKPEERLNFTFGFNLNM